jgi:hypothetical protein
MKTSFFLTAFFLCTILAQGQVSITGTIIDIETSEPLPFASIGIKHKPIGTVSNLQGTFTFHIPQSYHEDTLYVSVMGYQPYEILLKNVSTTSHLRVALKPAPHYLNEVVIMDTLSGREILRRAVGKIKTNYPNTPFITEGFYREVQQADDRHVSLTEAALHIYHEGYANPKHPKAKVVQLRKSLRHRHPYHDWWDAKNLFLEFTKIDLLKHDSRELRKARQCTRKTITTIDRQPVYVVEVSDFYWPKRLYIRCDNYAIIRIEETFDGPPREDKSWMREGPQDSIRVYPRNRYTRIDFKEFEGKYYFSYLSMNFMLQYKNLHTGKMLFEFGVSHHFVTTNIITKHVTPVPAKDALQSSTSLEKQIYPYNALFWKDYNMILETPLDKKIRADLEKEAPLEEQFKKESGN